MNVQNQYIKYKLPFFQSEIYLIKWFPYAITKRHGHDGKECNYIPLKGNLFERRFMKNHKQLEKENQLKKFRKYSINDSIGEHMIINHDNYL